MSKLLTRDQFREAVFDRDGSVCVFCSEPAVDAHHILERRLWGDGGYYADNGVSVCREHHLQCERTLISPEDCREAAGIRKAILPEHLYPDQVYDKWGNPVQPNGQRLRGDLFWDESVQKVLAEGGVLDLFTHYVKYPRTYHLKHSPGITDDDRVHKTTEQWQGREVVVGLKMDGENCLEENTELVTEDGTKTIKDICESEYIGSVMSYNVMTAEPEFKPIIGHSIVNNNADWYEIESEDGETLVLTGEHRIWITNKNCYRMVKDLEDDDEILII